MITKLYSNLLENHAPSEELIQRTIRKANRIQKKVTPPLLKPALTFATIVLCSNLTLTALAAIEPVYQLMYLMSPSLAQHFIPVAKSSESNGIVMEVVSAYIHGNIAEIYLTLEDTTGNRIDETTDLYDSVSIHTPTDGSTYVEMLDFDHSTGKATFYLCFEEWGDKDISGDKITFSVRKILSQKKIGEEIEIPVDTSVTNAETINPEHIMGIKVEKSELANAGLIKTLKPQESLLTLDDLSISGVGYVEGKLHVQITVTNKFETDSHGFVYFEDDQGNRIEPTETIHFVNHYGEDRIFYTDFLFDIPQDELHNYRLLGDFVTNAQLIEGNWKVTFPLEHYEK